MHAQAGMACATIYLGGRTDWDNHFKPLHSTFKIGYLYTDCHVWHLFLILYSVTAPQHVEQVA